MMSNADDLFQHAVEGSRDVRDQALLPMLNWYRDNRKWPFIIFRTTGVLTILLSVCLPIVALIKFPGQPVSCWLRAHLSPV